MDDPAADVTTYFTDLVGAYAGHRPSYPPEAMRVAIAGLPAPVRAADVGAGTGISARLLADAGATVVAIDPNRAMLDEARRSTPGAAAITFHEASAETLPLEDGSVHVVLCAQSFHWFETERTLAEFHRVLAPGGRLALLWNLRETSDPLAAAYERVVARAQADAEARGLVVHRLRSHDPGGTGHFTNVRLHTFPNPQPLDVDGLIGRLRSASYFPPPGTLRDRLEAEMKAHLDRHGRDGQVILAHRTELTLADRVDGASASG